MTDAIRFDPHELRPQARQLLSHGQPVALGGRAFDLLVALVEGRGRVVPRAELVERVWPDRVVEENNLAVQVLALRRVLGERAIATVPGRGYRFTLAVGGDGEAAPPPAAAAPPPAAAAPSLLGQPPPPLSAMHGRSADLQVLLALLDAHRLVTLVGAGGIGKSTLAAAAVRERVGARRDGVVWVELGAVADPAQVPPAVGLALGLQAGPGDALLPALAAALRTRELLLVLDSAEHVIDAVARLAHGLLAAAPGVRLLATSQVPLKVEGERVLRLDTLAVPPADTPPAAALGHGAVALFVDQVRAADPHFGFDDGNVAAVIALCRRLDGHALAIKLAAARTPLLGLTALTARLTQSLRLLGEGQRHAPTRQQTLRATLDWSHALLSADEQAVFRRLGVFAGGFTLDLAQAVAIDEGIDAWAVVEHLAALVDRSLVAADAADPPRYRLLASTHEYALLQLSLSGETEALRRRHAAAVAASFEAADEALWSTPDGVWLARHAPEIDNLRAAIAWSLAHAPRLAVSLLGRGAALFDALVLRHEFRRGCEALAAATDLQPVDAANARLWRAWAIALSGCDHRRMQRCAAEAERMARALDDRRGLYLALCTRAMAVVAGSGEPAVRWADEALALEQPGWPPRLRAWGALACTIASADTDPAASLAAAERGIRLADDAGAALRTGHLRSWRVFALLSLSQLAPALQESAALLQALRGRPTLYPAWTIATHAQGLLMLDRPAQARPVLAELFDVCRAAEWDSFDFYADTLVLMALRERRGDDALRLVGWAEQVSQAIGMEWPRSIVFRNRLKAAQQAAIGDAACAALLAEGRALDREAVCAVTLREA